MRRCGAPPWMPDGETVAMDIALDYAIDGTSLIVNRLSQDAADLATAGFAMSADGIDPYERDPSLVALGLSISSAGITFQNAGVIALLLEQAARLANTSIEQAAARVVEEMEFRAMEANSPQGRDAYLDLADFMRAGPYPEGTLAIAVNPPTPFSPAMFMEIADPDAATRLLGLSITHRQPD